MSYTISPGIDESELKSWLEKALQKYGLYEGRGINYTHAKLAPIVMCTVVCREEILLVKRGYGLADAEGYWSTVNGFIDEIKPVREIACQELQEELDLTVPNGDIRVGHSYTVKNPKEKRLYVVFPCLVEVPSKPDIKLDSEHTEYRWVRREEVPRYHILEDLLHTIDAALSLK